MTIKRALFAMIAMMMLPALAAAGITPPPVTPAMGTAVIATVAYFDNGNDEDTVAVNITCSAGSINPTSAELGDGEGQSFVLSNIPDGVTATCKVTQSAVAGYDTNYLCAPGSAGAPDVGDVGAATSCSNPDFDVNVATSCEFNDVQPFIGDGDPVAENVGYCAMINAVAPVKYKVTKVWDVSNAGGGDYTDLTASVIITCNDENGETVYAPKTIVGNGSVTVNVYPEYDGTSVCSTEEDVVDSAVEVDKDSGCTRAKITVGNGATCTITNTVFFEGIPTLNQYGMAIMALLMLGVGFIGFRRFV